MVQENAPIFLACTGYLGSTQTSRSVCRIQGAGYGTSNITGCWTCFSDFIRANRTNSRRRGKPLYPCNMAWGDCYSKVCVWGFYYTSKALSENGNSCKSYVL